MSLKHSKRTTRRPMFEVPREDRFESNVSQLLAKIAGNQAIMYLIKKDKKLVGLIESIDDYYEENDKI